MNEEDEGLILTVRSQIAALAQLVSQVTERQLPRAHSLRNQAHALLRDVVKGLDQILVGIKENRIPRIIGLALAAQGQAAIASVENAGFNPS